MAVLAAQWGVGVEDLDSVRLLPSAESEGQSLSVLVVTRLEYGLVERTLVVWPPVDGAR